MKTRPVVESLIYALIVILALAALWLEASVPANFMDAHAVYQGF